MNHRDFATQLGPWLDGELPAPTAADMEGHVRECRDCAQAHANAVTLRLVIGAHAPSISAPDVLQMRVRQAIRREIGSASSAPGRTWLGLAAAALIVVGTASWQLAARRAEAGRLTEDLVASHVRSLMAGHTTDVTSTDQHTVKPWFNGKLDYALPVYDFAGRGFPLVGGRLDYVDGRRVAALVYERRSHVINVYLWPVALGGTGGAAAETQQGYHLMHWAAPDFTYWVVSDLGVGELADFTHLLQTADSAAR